MRPTGWDELVDEREEEEEELVDDDIDECLGVMICADVESELLFDCGSVLIITIFGFRNSPHLKQ